MVGGGPAGLAVAIAARHRGLRVVVADGAQMPIDKPCGEGLLPDGLAALQELGITIDDGNSVPFRGVRFLSAGLSVEAEFPSASCGRGVRRTVLHELMAERSRCMGTEILWNAPVTGIAKDGVLLGRHKINARWIIGADGGNSRVRSWAGLDVFRKRRCRFAFRRHFRVAPWADRMELYWGQPGEIYVTPVSREQVCVSLISRDSKLRLQEALAKFPELKSRLGGAEPTSAERGSMTATCKLQKVSRGNVALIGDASGTVDAITGEGLCLAFSQAAVLADCMEKGDLSRYEREHRRLAMRPLLMARLMLLLDGRPRIQRRTLEAFRKRPHIFRRLLALHVGVLSPLHLAVDGMNLGWGLLTA